MDIRWLAILPVFAVIFSGCTSDPSAIITASPAVSQFLEEHPNADITVIHYSQDEAAGIADRIAADCGKDVTPSEFYFVNVSDQESGLYLISWINWDTQAVECAVKRGVGNATEPASSCAPECVHGECIDENTCACEDGWEGDICDTEISAGTETTLADAEQKLQETVCNAFPTNAARLSNDMLIIGVLLPTDLNEKVGALGDQITLDSLPEVFYMAYNNGKRVDYQEYGTYDETYIQCFYRFESVCLIAFTADLSDDNGNKIATERGAIKLVFQGSTSVRQEDPPYPVLERIGCELEIDRPCEVPEGYSLCGQCSYAFTYSTINGGYGLSRRGTCLSCPPGKHCSSTNDADQCEYATCINDVTAPPAGNYYVSCCSVRYSGTNRERCNWYWNRCYALEPNCPDKKSLC